MATATPVADQFTFNKDVLGVDIRDADGAGGDANIVLDPLDLFGARAGKAATELQRRLAKEGLALQKEFADILFAESRPVRATRDLAINALRGDVGYDPGFEFQRGEALDRVNRGATAAGKAFSGQNLMNLQDTDAALASSGTRNRLNRLLNVAGFETSALSNQNQLLQGNVNRQSNALLDIGQITDAGRVARSNNLTNLVNQGAAIGSSLR